MNIELKVPEVGESITEVEIGDWLKTEGDQLKKDETVALIESEKATVELPAPESGVLMKILKKKGEAAKVGETIAHMEVTEPPKGTDTNAAKTEPETRASTKAAAPATPSSAPPPRTPPPADQVSAEPDLNADEVQTAGVGAGLVEEESAGHRKPQEPTPPLGRLPGAQPPLAPTEPAQRTREEQVVPMTLLRRTLAKRLVEAQHAAALLTTFNEIDMSAVLALRQQYQEAFKTRFGVKLGLMSFFVKASTDALKLVPQLNAEIRGTDIVYHNYHDIGIAVSTDRGLLVPVLREVDRLSFAEIDRAIADFAQRARENKVRPQELEGGTFSITNGGVFGSLLSTPLVNPPQSGILGMHAIQERPIAVAGQVVIRPMMFVALTYDHRIVDGREAVIFLRRIKETIENPARMILEV